MGVPWAELLCAEGDWEAGLGWLDLLVVCRSGPLLPCWLVVWPL